MSVVRVMLCAVVVSMLACAAPAGTAPARPNSFRELHRESWGSWDLYVVQHSSGVCLIAVDPPGDGGGTIAEIDAKVCEYELRPER